MKLLSISIPYHDANISYFDGNKVKYIKLERSKNIKRFTYDNFWEWKYDIQYLLGVDLNKIDEIVIETYLSLFFKNYPNEVKDIIDGKINFTKLPESFVKLFCENKNIWFIGHHYAHSLSTWMLEDKIPDVNIVIDGLGDARTWTVFKNNKVIDKGDLNNGSIGWGIREAGMLLNIKYGHCNDIAGKVMGLQSYGKLNKEYLKLLEKFNIYNINEIFSYENWCKFNDDIMLANHSALDWIHTVHCRMENVLLDFFKKYANKDDVISYSGGVAQNVIWNTKLKEYFKNLIIPPHSSDEGLSLGGLEFLRIKNNLNKFIFDNFPYIQNDVAPSDVINENNIKLVAELLSKGKTVGIYQENGEAGPRALGNRSILMDPRIKNGKKIINKIKQRENYRPFGASVLKEYVNDYFELSHDDDFMLYTTKVKTNKLEAITNIDNTCRVQTVNDNSIIKKILEEFFKITGCAVLLNTSLNIAGKPLVAHPESAFQIFNTSSLDCLAIGNSVYLKNNI